MTGNTEPQATTENIAPTNDGIHNAMLQNFQKMSFDHQVIFFCQIATGLFCFFPWVSLAPFYGMWLHRNAFQGETWLMGILLFLICCGVVVFILNKIAGRREIPIPVSESLFFRFFTFLGLFTLVLAWSVLMEVQGGYEDADMKFGLGGAFVTQALSCVGAWQLRPHNKKNTKKNITENSSLNTDHLFHHEE